MALIFSPKLSSVQISNQSRLSKRHYFLTWREDQWYIVYFILIYFSLFLTGHFSSVQEPNVFVTIALHFISNTHCSFPFFFNYENQYNLMYKPKEVDFTNYMQHNSKIRIFVHIFIYFFLVSCWLLFYCFLLHFIIIKDVRCSFDAYVLWRVYKLS